MCKVVNKCKPKACHGDVLKELVDALPQGVDPMYTWARKSNKVSIECSSVGIKELSALYAKLPSGRTIEEHYQCDVKGYDIGGTKWQLGKGKPPLKTYTGDDLYLAYLGLWQSYFMYNPHLLLGIYSTGITILTDTFATTPINQARAIADCMNAVCFKQLFVDGAVLNQYQQKDAQKARFANKFIGQGSTKSSTAQYARVYGTEANSGTYTPTDVVYVSVEGNRANRKPLDTVELQKALDAKAFIIADKPYDRNRPYNVGERELAEYLNAHEYVEIHSTGIWMHKSHRS